MKKRKTMKLWQMITILLLSLTMIITMFLPAFRINGSVIEKMVETVAEGVDLEKYGYSQEDLKEDLEEGSYAKQIDKSIKDYEEKNNCNISKISPLSIMIKSCEKFMWGDDVTEKQLKEYEKNDSYKKVQSAYNMLKIVLWVVYVLAFVVALLTVLGFCLKWTKFIPLITSAVYGLIAAITFGYLRFGLMGKIAGIVKSEFENSDAESLVGYVFGTFDSEVPWSKVMSHLHSYAFVIAFIVSILILIASIVSIFVGNRVTITTDDENDLHDEDGAYFSNNGVVTEGGIESVNSFDSNPMPSADWKVPQAYTQPIQSQPVQPVVAPMGQVKCTQGISAGQGFMLPEDRKVIVGKSPQNANLVINNQNVSNVHCSIRYNAATNTYIIKDHSTNGTFVNGVRLQNNVAMEYPAGTVLCLADGSNQITLG